MVNGTERRTVCAIEIEIEVEIEDVARPRPALKYAAIMLAHILADNKAPSVSSTMTSCVSNMQATQTRH